MTEEWPCLWEVESHLAAHHIIGNPVCTLVKYVWLQAYGSLSWAI